MDKAWVFRRMWAAVRRGDKQTWNYLRDALAKGEIVLQSPLSEGQFPHPGSPGEKAAVSIWRRKWCRIKVTSLCPSPLAPEYTSPHSICGSDIKLGFQLLFPANVLIIHIPILRTSFYGFQSSLGFWQWLCWVFSLGSLNILYLWHILCQSLCPRGSCYKQKSLLK